MDIEQLKAVNDRLDKLESNQKEFVTVVTEVLKTIQRMEKAVTLGFEDRDKELKLLIAKQKKIVRAVDPIVHEYRTYQHNLLERMFAHADRCQEHDI